MIYSHNVFDYIGMYIIHGCRYTKTEYQQNEIVVETIILSSKDTCSYGRIKDMSLKSTILFMQEQSSKIYLTYFVSTYKNFVCGNRDVTKSNFHNF